MKPSDMHPATSKLPLDAVGYTPTAPPPGNRISENQNLIHSNTVMRNDQ
jgi:hypothetical protein